MKVILLLALIAVVSAGYTGRTNKAGLDLIKSYEGWMPTFYTDSVGIKTIGYGHACHVHNCAVPINGKYTPPLTKAQGEQLLASDLQTRGYESCVKSAVKYANLNANQYSALVSFVYNLGCGSLKKSALLRKLNAGDVPGASAEFGKWVKAGGKTLRGLVKRREAERALFCSSGGCGSGTSVASCKGNVSATTLNVRSAPKTSAAITGSLGHQAPVTISGRAEGDVVRGNKFWFKVPNGYVSAYYINIASTNGARWCSKN